MGKMNTATAFLMMITCLGFLGSGCAHLMGACPMEFDPAPPLKIAALQPLSYAPPPADTLGKPLLTPDIPSIWPLQEDYRTILSPYGPRGKRRGGPGRFHRAVDIRAPSGAPIFATAPGVVKQVSSRGNYGKLVVIEHARGYASAYAHLSAIQVKMGQEVKQGEQIGAAGRTGNASTSHLHYEVRRDGKYLDPSNYLPKN